MNLNLFAITAIKWLYHLDSPNIDGAEFTGLILDRMANVVSITESRGGRKLAGNNTIPDDVVWITALWRNRHTLSTRHGAQFRRLLHGFERCQHQAMLVGNSDTICRYLRWSMQEAHKGIDVCDHDPDAVCHWLSSHTCNSTPCPALGPPPGSALGPAYTVPREDKERTETLPTNTISLFSPAPSGIITVDIEIPKPDVEVEVVAALIHDT